MFKFGSREKTALNPPGKSKELLEFAEYVVKYDDLRYADLASVGFKNAYLGEIKASLTQVGVNISDGFALNVAGYRAFLQHNNLITPIGNILAKLKNPTGSSELTKAANKIRKLILRGSLPKQIQDELSSAYAMLQQKYGKSVEVAVRSSPTADDVPTSSLIRRQFSLLNVSGLQSIQQGCLEIYASLFSERSLAHCLHLDLDVLDIGMSVGIQKMVRSDQGIAGVMCTLDIQTDFRDVVSISSSYGLGELLAEGGVSPDEFLVFKPTLSQGFSAILKRHRGSKAKKRVYCVNGATAASTYDLATTLDQRIRFSLDKQQIMDLARLGVAIEQHHECLDGEAIPLEIEWAQDGVDGQFYILQVRPDPSSLHRKKSGYVDYKLLESGWALVTGAGVGHKIVTGRARVVSNATEAAQLEPGEILIADTTTPAWETAIHKAAALVTNQGGRYSHAAMIAQQFEIPAVVGCSNATSAVETGSEVTVACIERDVGYVYDGILDYTCHKRPNVVEKTNTTRLSVNISNPERAFEYAGLPVDGVGLAKMEYVINHHIKIHPRALLEYEGQTPEVQSAIDDMVAGYSNRRSFYVNRLCEGVGMIAAAFYPKPVMLRTSDFRSNEYAALYAGEFFEAHEANPEIGLRGATRYFSPQWEECFALECEAIRNAREKMGLTNLHLVVPFVRTVDEGVRLLELLETHGLKRGDKGLRINLMCETPANALLAEEFLEHFDGFSIGTDDLLQLTVGIDRDAPYFADIDERNKAVLKLISMAIKTCFNHGKHVSICGKAVSELPDLNRWLVKQGVHEISLLPENFFEMQKIICQIENSRNQAELDIPERLVTFKIPA